MITVSAAYYDVFLHSCRGFWFAPRPALVLFPWSLCPTDLLVGTVPCPAHPCGAWQVVSVSFSSRIAHLVTLGTMIQPISLFEITS